MKEKTKLGEILEHAGGLLGVQHAQWGQVCWMRYSNT